ncbi:MAG TPA: DNA polymerase III subunit delta' [Bacteroidota bacterium]|nr:DNA polymerase III subunit delta' [Bacteroidota bacterium]
MSNIWDTVIGQRHAKQLLSKAREQDRLAHAYLFWGPEGVGKSALALAFAKTLLCEEGGTTACGHCPSCRKMITLQHPNLKLIFALPGGEGKKNDDGDSLDAELRDEIRRQVARKAIQPYAQISIPKAVAIRIRDIRAIRKETSMTATERGKKIFILLDVDTMNEPSANAFLKILEEPPDDTLFLLITAHKEQVRQTILSRCQAVQCVRLKEDEIAQALVDHEQVDATRARLTARLSDGSYSRALDLLNEDLDKERTDAVAFLRGCLGNAVLKYFDDQDEYFSSKKREPVEQLLHLLLVWFRDAIIFREQGETGVINHDQLGDLERFVSRFGTADLAACAGAVERALGLLRRNVYLPLVLLSLTVQLKRLLLHGN